MPLWQISLPAFHQHIRLRILKGLCIRLRTNMPIHEHVDIFINIVTCIHDIDHLQVSNPRPPPPQMS